MAAQASESESGKVTVRLGGETRDRLEREASAERRQLASMAKLLIEDPGGASKEAGHGNRGAFAECAAG